MDIKDFIIEFCPDFSKKYRESPDGINGGGLSWTFIYVHFEESLKNFTDQICERQRINCLRVWQFNREPHLEGDEIRYAEQPKIEDVLTKK